LIIVCLTSIVAVMGCQQLSVTQSAVDAVALANVNPDIGGLASFASFILQRPDAGDIARTVLGFHPLHREVACRSHRTLPTVGGVEDASQLIPLVKDDSWFPTASIRHN
jgi:hypothetical protein